MQSHENHTQVSADISIKDVEIKYLAHQYNHKELSN